MPIFKLTRLILLFSRYTLLFCIFQSHAKNINVVTEYLPPYQIANADGSLGGFATEVIKELFELTGDKADIYVMPWARAYKEASHRKNTMIYSIAHTTMRAPLFNWIGTLKQVRLYVWGLKPTFNKAVKSINELKQYNVAISRRTSAGQYIQYLPFANVYPVVHEDQAMKMLFKHRIDLLVGSELLFRNRAKKLQLDFSQMTKLIEIKELNVDLCIAFSKDTDPNILLRFKKAYKILETSGKLDEIRKKWAIKKYH